MTPQRYDVVIVGGGILGCATAYQLARYQAGKVLVIERQTLGAATTSRAAALLTRSRSEANDRALIRGTFEAMARLHQDHGEDIPFNRSGSLHVAESVESAAALRTAMAQMAAEGQAVDWLSPAEACDLTGWLSLDTAAAIAFMADDGYVDPYILCSAYVRAAKSLGVTFRQGCEVLSIAPDRVMTDQGKVAAGQVVLATGPWMNMLLGTAPLAPVRSQYWITATHDRIRRDGPVTVLPDARAYARPEVGGLLFGIRDDDAVYAVPSALPKDLSGFAFTEDYDGWQALEHSVGPFLQRCDLLNHLEIAHYISGPSAYTPDGRFVIGAHEGYWLIGGCCGAGIAMSGGSSDLLARQMLGLPPIMDGRAYLPGRLGAVDGHGPDFLKSCAMARVAKRAG